MGTFYMSIGDGGRKIRAQNYNNLDGSFIRLDFDSGVFPYSIPPDNPFVNGGGRVEIFVKGLRNPWRWCFDDLTHQIFLGDVGKSDCEEINLIESGKNYGWPIRQGALCHEPTNCNPAGLTDPIVEYPHDSTGGIAVIGGFVYRGTAMPTLYGHYIYADHTGRIWGFNTNNLSNPNPTVLLEAAFGKHSFAQGMDKELYLLGEDSIEKLVPGQGSNGTNPLPNLLSMTGCFDSTSPLVANQALIPYELNTPLWSDDAEKQRWMRLPGNGKITVTGSDDWEYPIGSVLVKNFSLQTQLVETRLFIRHDDGGWAGYTYEWNDNQTDATLVPSEGSEKQVGGQLWQYPTRVQCMQCHTSVSGFTIGPETAQLNLNFTNPNNGSSSNQLTELSGRGIFANANFSNPSRLPKLAAIDDESQTKHWRSRSYLYSNCAMCHQPGGPGRGPEDFRFAATDQQMNAINVDPTINDLGVNNGKLILPGDASKSIMALRMHSLDPNTRMPPLSTSMEDSQATDIIDEWIDSIDDQPANFSQSCDQPIVDRNTQNGIVL